ncbi:MAG: hypothetical protein HKM89_02000 [Gemmatimonadales bacterium]|nr:hypothetical protein [Gemmatimonadales bacterium]
MDWKARRLTLMALAVAASTLPAGVVSSQEQVRTCGLGGTVAARVNECALIFGYELTVRRVEPLPATGQFSELDQPTPVVWRLVARTGGKLLVWKEEATGLLWIFVGDFNLYIQAERACQRFSLGLGLTWRIPQESTLEVARQHKLFDVLNQPGEYLTRVTQTSPERRLISHTPAKYAACVAR